MMYVDMKCLGWQIALHIATDGHVNTLMYIRVPVALNTLFKA
jgi:hypothetical protein